MLESGEVVDLSDVPGFKVDKHSTGGVGDKVSLCLAPLVAACGPRVPMMSGRGLGHTGGTVDKLESIPGFNVRQDTQAYRAIVAKHGLCLIGQTATLAPADRKLYALRDVTATVESIPLIASSIMSKKLAEGIDGLVLDVKTGSGAFMKTLDDSRALARAMIDIGRGMNKRMVALITDMSQPLGRAVGNANEMAEAIDVLHGRGPADLIENTLALGVEMLVMAGAARGEDDARARLQRAIADGSGLRKLRDVVAAQGGDPRCVDDPTRLPRARKRIDVALGAAGTVATIDTESIGIAAVMLGAGREKVDDVVDHGVGLTIHKRIGDRVAPDEPVVTVFYDDDARVPPVVERLKHAYHLVPGAVTPPALVQERVA
jgi:pyrimidine-nucleoside phosphorylase